MEQKSTLENGQSAHIVGSIADVEWINASYLVFSHHPRNFFFRYLKLFPWRLFEVSHSYGQKTYLEVSISCCSCSEIGATIFPENFGGSMKRFGGFFRFFSNFLTIKPYRCTEGRWRRKFVWELSLMVLRLT